MAFTDLFQVLTKHSAIAGARLSKVLVIFLLVFFHLWRNVMDSTCLTSRLASQVLVLEESSAMSNNLRGNHRPPLVTFVIPSSLKRESLHQTLQSLSNQTDGDWEAVVGVDLHTMGLPSQFETAEVVSLILSKSQSFWSTNDDPRVRFVPIQTSSDHRGKKHNGAGDVRNHIIRHFVQSEWVAFVDDDDTLAANYVEQLRKGITQKRSSGMDMDILIFRMKNGQRILPKPGLSRTIQKNDVGISYALRRNLFLLRPSKIARATRPPLQFVADPAEDYLLLQSARDAGYSIYLSSCIGYYVREEPQLSLAPTMQNCTLSKTQIEDQSYQPDQISVTEYQFSSSDPGASKTRAITTVTIAK